MSYSESQPPTHLARVLAVTEETLAHSRVTLEGTRPDGPGAAALNGLVYAVDALRQAQQNVQAAGEHGI